MKTMLILSGPQGSGNHLWSKVLSIHPAVYGWKELNQTYWIGHDQEPFNECWKNSELLKEFDWSQSDYYMTSISVPYMENGEPVVVDIKKFGETLESLGIRVIYGIIGRDKNILSYQEQRLRGSETYHMARSVYRSLPMDKIYYLSHELLILYEQQYLEKIAADLKFPIDTSDAVNAILADNANAKYLKPIDNHWVDELARHTSRKWK